MITGRRAATRVTGVILIAALTACGDRSQPAPAARAASRAPVATSSTTSAEPVPAASTAQPHPASGVRAGVRTALRSIEKRQPDGAISVAALNTATGQRFVDGQTSGMFTASSYKLLCLAALLIHRSPSSLSDAEVASAEAAIEHSDNVAGYQLFLDVGGQPGLTAALRTFGMSHTTPGQSDPTFTTTSGADYLTLLEALSGYVRNDPLRPRARSFVLNLMGQVESDQRWGVGAAAQKGTKFYNKNGWISVENGNGAGESDNGLWAVTSAGILTVKGQRVLMAVFTQHQPDFDTGVALVNRLARLIAPAVAR